MSNSAKYASIAAREKRIPKHRAHAINATPHMDREPVWHVVCADCAHEWRRTNALDHGAFTVEGAAAFIKQHNQIHRLIIKKRETA